MLHLLLLPVLLATAQAPDSLPGPKVDQAQEQNRTDATLALATPEARRAWAELLQASGGLRGERSAIRAFELVASVLTRDGVQTNEAEHFRYRFLAPDLIRFTLPDGNEIGRYGTRQKEYWLSTTEGEVTVLSGSTYAEDRRQIQQMHAVARNFVALSDLVQLRDISRLELLDGPPADFGPELWRRAKKLRWLRVTSPSFALMPRDTASPIASTYQVDMGLETKTATRGLPRMAVIREAGTARVGTSPPMLFLLKNYALEDGFRIPRTLLVHHLDPRGSSGSRIAFSKRPAQEIYVEEANLKPEWTEANFKPE